MKLIGSAFLVLLFSYQSIARVAADSSAPSAHRVAFKLYNLATISPTIKTGNNSLVHEFVEQDYLQPAVAVRLENRSGNFHELELSQFSIRKKEDRYSVSLPNGAPVTTAGTQVNTTALAARYEYTRAFMKKRQAAFIPSLGFAGSVFYERFKTVPYTTNVYPIAETMTGLRSFLIPRLNWYAGKRLFFDLNVPVCVLSAGYRHSNQQNPTVPVAAQKIGLLELELLPNYYSFRLGLGWKL